MTFAQQYGPWALIAGASEGTGSAFAHKLAAEGINCILIARREGPLLSLKQALHRQYDIECVTATIDLSATDALDRMVEAVAGREVGLLICNAGGDSINQPFLDHDIDDWSLLANRNISTVMHSCHYFGRLMRERRRGGILLVGSGSCYGGASYMAVYAGTKAFDLCFGEGLWAELKPHGVDVLNLILGQTDTPAFRAMLEKQGLPIPSNLASPREVADVGLARLAHGPVHNWGQADEEAGFAPSSAAARRARIIAIDTATQSIFKRD